MSLVYRVTRSSMLPHDIRRQVAHQRLHLLHAVVREEHVHGQGAVAPAILPRRLLQHEHLSAPLPSCHRRREPGIPGAHDDYLRAQFCIHVRVPSRRGFATDGDTRRGAPPSIGGPPKQVNASPLRCIPVRSLRLHTRSP